MIFRLKYADRDACDLRPSLHAACGFHNARPIHPVCKSKYRQHLSATHTWIGAKTFVEAGVIHLTGFNPL